MDPSCSTTVACAETDLEAISNASYPETLAQGSTPAPQQTVPPLKPSITRTTAKLNRGWRRIVRNFTPSWFAVNMGTGIVSILLNNLPYNARWLRYISYIVFCLNIMLFVLFTLISVVRYTLYPRIWMAMIQHPQQSLFVGCWPMGLATIINMIVFVCVPAWGGDWWKLAWALWWVDVVAAMGSCLYLPFVIMSMHDYSPHLQKMTATWLLPIVATIVASASGGLVAGILPHAHDALLTLITSYVLWGTGFPLAMCVLVIYFLRLTTAHLPAKEAVVSTFLPLGPLGMGGFSLMTLGKVAMELFPQTHTLSASRMVAAGDFLYLSGFLTALILWGAGLVWLFFAIATIYRTQRFPFNMGWWGFTFPLGVYATSTTTLAGEIPSGFFRVLGTVFSVAVVLLWIVVALGTLKRAWTGEMFFAPCLKDLEINTMVVGHLDEREKAAVGGVP